MFHDGNDKVFVNLLKAHPTEIKLFELPCALNRHIVEFAYPPFRPCAKCNVVFSLEYFKDVRIGYRDVCFYCSHDVLDTWVQSNWLRVGLMPVTYESEPYDTMWSIYGIKLPEWTRMFAVLDSFQFSEFMLLDFITDIIFLAEFYRYPEGLIPLKKMKEAKAHVGLQLYMINEGYFLPSIEEENVMEMDWEPYPFF